MSFGGPFKETFLLTDLHNCIRYTVRDGTVVGVLFDFCSSVETEP